MHITRGLVVKCAICVALVAWMGAVSAAAQGPIPQADVPSAVATSGSGPRADPPFLIYNGPGVTFSYSPDIAYNPTDREFLVVWSEHVDENTRMIYARRVGLDESLGGLITVAGVASTKRDNPSVAFSTQQHKYLVVYDVWSGSDQNVVGTLVNWNGSIVGGEFAISNTVDYESSPDVAYNSEDDEFLVVWDATPDHLFHRAKARRVRPSDGTLLGLGATVDNEPSHSPVFPRVVYNAVRNQYLVAYGYSDGSDANVRARLLLANASPAASIFTPCGISGNQEVAAAVAGNDEYLVASMDFATDPVRARARRITGGGSPMGQDCGYLIYGDGGQVQNLDTALAYAPDGRYLAAWSYFPVGGTVYNVGARYLAAGSNAASGAEFPVNAATHDQKKVAVACASSGDCLVAYANDYAIMPGQTVPLYLSGSMVHLGRVFLPLSLRSYGP